MRAAQWNPLVVLSLRNDLMASRSLCMPGDSISAVPNFDLAAVLAHPYLFARILPGHRVATSLPRNVSVAGYLALFVVAIRIGRPSVDRLQVDSIFVPTDQHLLVRCPVHC